MAYQYHINKHHHLCYVVLYDVVDGDQLVEAVSSVMDHPDWRPGYNTLWDGSSITNIVFRLRSVRRVQRAAAALSGAIGSGKSAYVAPRRSHYLAVRFLKAGLRIPGREIRLFTTLDEARAWLGLINTPPEVLAGTNTARSNS